MTNDPRHRVRSALVVVALVLGCNSWRHAYTVAEFQGQFLRVKEGGPGAERLRIERGYDPTVEHYVDQYGEPDYLLVVDRTTLQLAYLDANRVAVFKRPVLAPRSDVSLTTVSDELVPFLDAQERARLDRARTTPTSADPIAATPLTVQSLQSVVRIDTGKTIGSGFFVTDALVATNAHVLAGASSARLSSGQGAGVIATVSYVDRDLDFAVLESPVKAKPLPVREGPITEGEGVTAIGFPQGRDVVAASTGTVHAVNEVVIVHDALIAAGSSGGPLVGSDGRVLGVNTILTKARGDRANATDRVIAVKITTILKKLESR